jgi:hypothetical protein
MTPENRNAYMKLMSAKSLAGELYGRLRTNSRKAKGLFEPGKAKTSRNQYSGVCKVISRVNHRWAESSDVFRNSEFPLAAAQIVARSSTWTHSPSFYEQIGEY